MAAAFHDQPAVLLVQFRHEIGREVHSRDAQQQAGIVEQGRQIALVIERHVHDTGKRHGTCGIQPCGRGGSALGLTATRTNPAASCTAIAFGLVDGREALLVLEVRNFPHAAGLAVVAPAVIATLDPALLADAAEGQGRAPVGTAVLERAA